MILEGGGPRSRCLRFAYYGLINRGEGPKVVWLSRAKAGSGVSGGPQVGAFQVVAIEQSADL